MFNIILYTIREALARKLFMIFIAISTLVILGFILFFSLFDVSGLVSQSEKAGIGLQVMVENFVNQLKIMIVGPLYAGCLFISIFSMAGIISNLLEKGNIDLFLSKPISRPQLLLGKYFGGLTVILINVLYVILGIWLLMGIKFSIWNANFLLSVLVITYAFSVIYSLIILIIILTRSSALALILSYFIFFIMNPLLTRREMVYSYNDSWYMKGILEGLYYILPQTSELGNVAVIVAFGTGEINTKTLIVSLVQILLMMGAAITVFNKKDY